ncbi:MAG: S-adenosylmethionine decarboxylase [Acidobacteria bacterium]|nr:S-adenosylmethionine decarboxylase [Acidobacteriota bacterium]
MHPEPAAGCEWIVEAYGCAPAALKDLDKLQALFGRVIEDLALKPVCPAVWHRFPAPGGVTGVCLLGESHLAVHTFPEHGTLCFNLFCCRPRPEWDFDSALKQEFGAASVHVRRVDRPYERT